MIESRKHAFSVLGLVPQSTLEQVKKRYKKLALEYHPDKNKSPDAETKFCQFSEAYLYLMEYGLDGPENDDDDEEKNMRKYGISKDALNKLFSDIANEIYSLGKFKYESIDTTPMLHSEPLTIREIFNGCSKTIEIEVEYETGKKIINNGFIKVEEPVYGVRKEKYSVAIPRCKNTSAPIMYKDLVNTRGRKRDLYIYIELIPDPDYRMEGTTLITTVDISIKDMLFGFSKQIPGLGPGVMINICSGRVDNLGIPMVICGCGYNPESDLLVYFNLVLPQSIDKEEAEIIQSLKCFRDINVAPPPPPPQHLPPPPPPPQAQ